MSGPTRSPCGHARHQREAAASSICVLSFWLAWKVTTRRAEMGISSPVLGLRPGRWGLSRNWKLPKPESLTDSPRCKASRISSKKVSTMSLASRLFRPTRSKSISASSALVRVKFSTTGGVIGSSGSFRGRPRSIRPASEASLTGSDMGIGYRCNPQGWLRSAQARTETVGQTGHDRVDRAGGFGVAQSLASILHPNPEGKAFFLIFQTLTAIFVEQPHVFYALGNALLGARKFDLGGDPTGRYRLVDHQRDVAHDRRKARYLLVHRHVHGQQRRERDFEEDRRAGEFEARHQAGMEFADPADRLAVQVDPGTAAGVEGRVAFGLAVQPLAHERFEVALQVEEVHHAPRQAPLLLARRPVGQRGEPHRLVDPGHGEGAGPHGGIGLED